MTIGKDDDGNPVAAKIVFVRDRSKKSWLALLSTDTALADEEIIKLYGRRWDIEVFFKMNKSFLKLPKECESRSFDALVAHTTVCCAATSCWSSQEEPTPIRGPSATCSMPPAMNSGKRASSRPWHCY